MLPSAITAPDRQFMPCRISAVDTTDEFSFLSIFTPSKLLIDLSIKQVELYLMRLPPEILNQSKS